MLPAISDAKRSSVKLNRSAVLARKTVILRTRSYQYPNKWIKLRRYSVIYTTKHSLPPNSSMNGPLRICAPIRSVRAFTIHPATCHRSSRHLYTARQTQTPDLPIKDPLDNYLSDLARDIYARNHTSISTLYQQYRNNHGLILDHLVIPYEEYPALGRRAYNTSDESSDGIVLVVHALLSPDGEKVEKICVCSGFVVDAQKNGEAETNGEVVVTCAHTLEEVNL